MYRPLALTYIHIPPCRASKAKVLRLEKEAREMERTLEAFRHSQAKMAELEKMNKKLYSNAHIDKREIIKLKEVWKTFFRFLISL